LGKFRNRIVLVALLVMSVFAGARPVQAAPRQAELTDAQLLTEVQRRACRFFWDESDPHTGLTKDRADNTGSDTYTVASIASTGYALASLPVAVTHHWTDRRAAYARALVTLRFVHDRLPQVHGWYYHFIDQHTGERVWKCEISSIDTTLLIEGALMAGQFWPRTEVSRLADDLSERLDWTWMRSNGGDSPQKRVVSMGWHPEDGFIASNWDRYDELMQLYLLGMSSHRDPLPADSWNAWERNKIEYGGLTALAGGPIFLHEMSHLYFNFRDQRDSSGWDYWVSSTNAVKINRQFCIDKSAGRKSYGPDLWGLNASDAPDGYRAYSAPGSDEDGTLSPTGAIAALLFTPEASQAAGQAMYARVKAKCWGRYGFGDAFNLDKDWYDKDVIGIDLGMALLAIEDARTGLPWRLMASHPGLRRAWKLAGFHTTHEPSPRPLQKPPVPGKGKSVSARIDTRTRFARLDSERKRQKTAAL